MSWRRKEDLGTQTVAYVHEQLRLSDDFSLDVGRGFTYWPSDHALTVNSDLPNFHNAYSIFRLHSEIEVAHAGGRHEELSLALADRMSRASLSALCYDAEKDVYKLHCSVFAHTDNKEWLSRVLLAAVGLQIGKSHVLSADLSRIFGLEPVHTQHPVKGARSSADPLVASIEQFFRPQGAVPSRWSGSEEWEDAYRVMRRMGENTTCDSVSGLRSEFHWLSEQPMVLEISAVQPHPELGNGLSFVLRVPWGKDPMAIGKAAFDLNELERREWNWCHDLGSWSAQGSDLAFRCFVPNVCYVPGTLTDLSHDMALRARWVCDTAALELIGVYAA